MGQASSIAKRSSCLPKRLSVAHSSSSSNSNSLLLLLLLTQSHQQQPELPLLLFGFLPLLSLTRNILR